MTENSITLRVKGLPLTREAQEVDENGFSVFYLNPDKVDWTETANRARSQIFPDVSFPNVDHKFEAIMRARLERDPKRAREIDAKAESIMRRIRACQAGST